MRGLGGFLIALGAVLALIAAVWGRSGFYASQAPILFLLAVGALICLGAGSAMLRYQKTRFTTGSTAAATVAQRARLEAVPVVVTATAALDEATHDRPLPTSDWVLLLPDGTTLPVADGLVIGRQPVSADGGPTAAVPSTQVSKSQARFQISGGRLGIRDLDSTNGTVLVHPDDTEEWVSSIDETTIQPGDRLEIGSYVLEVQRAR